MVTRSRGRGNRDLCGLGELAGNADMTLRALDVGKDGVDNIVASMAEALMGELPGWVLLRRRPCGVLVNGHEGLGIDSAALSEVGRKPEEDVLVEVHGAVVIREAPTELVAAEAQHDGCLGLNDLLDGEKVCGKTRDVECSLENNDAWS